MAIGERIEVWPPVVLAPMAGVTNAPFRRLCRTFGAGLYVSEMISARALVEGSEKSWRLAAFADDERPRSLQLYGTEPTSVAGAVARLVETDSVDHIDMNFGCPVKKITRNGGGSALPWKRELFRDIVSAAVSNAGAVPVTIKFRLGIDDAHPTWADAGRVAEDEGCAAVALHARSAAQLYSGSADWTAIARLKETVTNIPVLGNGDIWEAGDALAMMRSTGCDGVVIGRGCLGRPWLFGELSDLFDGSPTRPAPSLGEVAAIIGRHADLLTEWFGEGAIRQFRKHACWYVKGWPVGSELRRRLATFESRAELDGVLAELDPDVPFPDTARRVVRSHSGGPQKVVLPEGWLDDRDDRPDLPEVAGMAVSGG